jgi:hypothetical protein
MGYDQAAEYSDRSPETWKLDELRDRQSKSRVRDVIAGELEHAKIIGSDKKLLLLLTRALQKCDTATPLTVDDNSWAA